MLIDTHAHLYWNNFTADYTCTIQRAYEGGVQIIINIGTNPQTNVQALNLKADKVKLYSTIGLHPHEAGSNLDNPEIVRLISEMEGLAKNNPRKIVGVGECGLDYFSASGQEFTPKELQLSLYKSQISLAKKVNLPLVIHCRDAWQDIFARELQGTTGVFHTFSGKLEDAQKALGLGFYLSFSCIITYPKNDDLRRIVQQTPLDKILTETDSPFLPPQNLRGQRNEPANVAEVVKVIAEAKSLPKAEIETQVYENAYKLFGL